jgi:hypothetical protein
MSLCSYSHLDDKWINKIQYVGENGAWILLTLDSFWREHLVNIYRLSQMGKKGFKIWIVVHEDAVQRLPGWIFDQASLIYREDSNENW